MRPSKCVLKTAALSVGIASIAATAGYLTGRTENDTVVGAAVVTGLLGLALGWFAFAAKDKDIGPSVLSSLGAVIFCTAFILVMRWTIKDLEQEERDALAQELILRQDLDLHKLDLNRQHLERCSELEFRINNERKKVGLPPLSSELVCGRP